jgi:hypothetical protein
VKANRRWFEKDQGGNDDLVFMDLGRPFPLPKPGQLFGRQFVLTKRKGNAAILWQSAREYVRVACANPPAVSGVEHIDQNFGNSLKPALLFG